MSETVNGKMGNTHSLTNSSTLADPIIQVKHLSKRYQIGMDRTYKTFCESVTDTIKSPLKRLKSFSRQEETFWALKDINFEVYPGEVVGIIGRNGAGKSTLLKILSRITHPTEGEVILRGRVGSLLEVGTGFHPELTGRENVYFNGAILGMKKQELEDKFDKIVKFAEIEQFLDTPVKRYSSGMYVRLAFAVAAHMDPEILLVDEVLAVGDVAFREKCFTNMKKLSDSGIPILLVSHQLPQISQFCRRIIWIDEGKIKEDGETKEVIEHYINYCTSISSSEIRNKEEKREKSNIAYLDYVRTLSVAGKPKTEFEMGEDIIVEAGYKIKEQIKRPVFGFSFFASDGIKIAMTNTMFDHKVPDLLSKDGVLRLRIKRPPFLTGNYSITVGIGMAEAQSATYDQWPNACAFRVLPLKDIYSTHLRYTGGDGVMACIDVSWDTSWIN